MNAQNVMNKLKDAAKPGDAEFLQRFFKTGVGQYGEGDVFVGVRMSQLRLVCKKIHWLAPCRNPKTF